MLDPAIIAQLTNDDDPALWDVATNTILADAAMIGREAKDDVFVQIGSCRHWIRPHQSRWIADGGFGGAHIWLRQDDDWILLSSVTGVGMVGVLQVDRRRMGTRPYRRSVPLAANRHPCSNDTTFSIGGSHDLDVTISFEQRKGRATLWFSQERRHLATGRPRNRRNLPNTRQLRDIGGEAPASVSF